MERVLEKYWFEIKRESGRTEQERMLGEEQLEEIGDDLSGNVVGDEADRGGGDSDDDPNPMTGDDGTGEEDNLSDEDHQGVLSPAPRPRRTSLYSRVAHFHAGDDHPVRRSAGASSLVGGISDSSNRRRSPASTEETSYLELVVDTSDGMTSTIPCDRMDCRDVPGALTLMLAKRPINGPGILYPDFSFHSWPEAECPGGDSHSWPVASLVKKSGADDFRKKIPSLFWRGADTSPARKRIIENLRTRRKVFVGKSETRIDMDVEWMSWRKRDSETMDSSQLHAGRDHGGRDHSVTALNFGGQSVASGQCIRVSDWCRYQVQHRSETRMHRAREQHSHCFSPSNGRAS